MGQKRNIRPAIQYNPVVAYADDVYAWVYLDREDNLIRYEAYVIDYDDWGRPTTLAFVIEEGAYAPDTWATVQAVLEEAGERPFTKDAWDRLHGVFAQVEEELKHRQRRPWSRRLQALGYDVIVHR